MDIGIFLCYDDMNILLEEDMPRYNDLDSRQRRHYSQYPQPARRRRLNIFKFIRFILIIGVLGTGVWLLFRFVFPYDETPEYIMQTSQAQAVATQIPSVSGVPAIPSTSPAIAMPVFDDMNYVSSTMEVHITIETIKNCKVHFADVTIKDSSVFKKIFANGKFGRNIKQTTSEMAAQQKAVFAVNGDYYGYRDDGIIVKDGKLYRNKPARKMLAYFADGRLEIIDEKTADINALLANGLLQTFSFGPSLLENGQFMPDDYKKSGLNPLNPRTGIGRLANNRFLFIVVDGRQEDSDGITLKDFAQVFLDKGCTEAYNLDGGGSSSMVFMDKLVNNPCGGVAGFSGIGGERSLSDAVCLIEPENHDIIINNKEE